jgi:hypothetical protein
VDTAVDQTRPPSPAVTFHPFGGVSLEALLAVRLPPFTSSDVHQQLRYVDEYAKELGCASIAIESHYIDRDYMEDHSVFYSKNLVSYGNWCHRVHFFSLPVEQVKAALRQIVDGNRNADNSQYKEQCAGFSEAAYLGFSVIKPLAGTPVGRTVLRTYPKIPTDTADRSWRLFAADHIYRTHLFGVELTVHGLAFQQQDTGVSACATTAIWSALQQLQNHEEIATPTPAQITTLAAKYSLPFGRAMPSEGLSIDQMCQAIQALGLAPLLYRVENDPINARAYLYYAVQSRLAPILILHKKSLWHAVVVAGVKYSLCDVTTRLQNSSREDVAIDPTGNVIGLYIHDDRLGLYLKGGLCGSNGSLQLIITTRDGKPTQVWDISHILIPLHSKIRLAFSHLRSFAGMLADQINRYSRRIVSVAPEIAGELPCVDVWIERAHRYIERLRVESKNLGADEIVAISNSLALARYLGVIRLRASYLDPIDVLIDTTSTQRNPSCIGVVAIGKDSSLTQVFAQHIAKDCGAPPPICPG